MADKKTTKKKTATNEYAGKSVKDLEKAYLKIESDYQQSLSKGKLTAQQTADLKRDRSRVLQALRAAELAVAKTK